MRLIEKSCFTHTQSNYPVFWEHFISNSSKVERPSIFTVTRLNFHYIVNYLRNSQISAVNFLSKVLMYYSSFCACLHNPWDIRDTQIMFFVVLN